VFKENKPVGQISETQLIGCFKIRCKINILCKWRH